MMLESKAVFLSVVLVACGQTVHEGAPSQSPPAATESDAASSYSALTAAQCNLYNGNVTACNAAGCAYYYCSNQCFPPGTSNCAAGCTQFCDCRVYDGNVDACNAVGCAYYYCSNQCHQPGTSNCAAGCIADCDCRSHDGDVDACDAEGCAYYYCSNQCHQPGTTNCAAGCNSDCPNTYDYASVCPTPSGGRYDKNKDVDAWSFWKCECTSYVADKLNEQGIAFNNHYLGVTWGNASNWKTAAGNAGVTVTDTPHTGDVAWFSGHVAYVESVNSNGTVNITEYNYSPPYDFNRRSSVTAQLYIRF